jgi:menaquinone-9 beta-reductase
VVAGDPASAGARYARATKRLLAGHLRHVATAARLCRHGGVVDAGLRASTSDQRVFDDLVELGLARGRLTTTMVRGLIRELANGTRSRRIRPRRNDL